MKIISLLLVFSVLAFAKNSNEKTFVHSTNGKSYWLIYETKLQAESLYDLNFQCDSLKLAAISSKKAIYRRLSDQSTMLGFSAMYVSDYESQLESEEYNDGFYSAICKIGLGRIWES